MFVRSCLDHVGAIKSITEGRAGRSSAGMTFDVRYVRFEPRQLHCIGGEYAMKRWSLSHALKERNAIVVHFSHHANMREGGVFPIDLHNAIENRAVWSLSTCVLWPGHNMDLPGSVGIIFRPLEANVNSVSPSDSGSFNGADGSDQSAGVPLSPESFLETFHPPDGGYNEWRVQGADVMGIFISDIERICVKKELKVPFGDRQMTTIGLAVATIDEVRISFPGLEVFTLDAGGLVPINPSGIR